MTAGLRIKEVADASGFTAATLRYYEQIGLLPEPSRTPAGYRMYDQRTLDRLAFIARAKQLGCSLDEITGLTTAWDGGKCGPIQDQLRELVAGKITAAQNQIAELVTFSAELQQAAAALERHRPEGACDSTCGCVSDANDTETVAATIQAVGLSAKPGDGGPARRSRAGCRLARQRAGSPTGNRCSLTWTVGNRSMVASDPCSPRPCRSET